MQEESGQTGLFFDKVHDEFITKLHDTFVEHYGIEVTNIRIESFRIMNSELAKNISTQAFVTAQTVSFYYLYIFTFKETQLANLTGQTEIATAQQRRDAEVARIKADGASVKLKTETDAKNRTTLESAKAEADAQVIRAKAEAQAIELRAEAEAKSILVRAEAEAKRAEMLNSTLLGGQIQLYQMYSEMVKESMNGVNKVIYMPTEGNNPMNFFAFQQGMIPGVTTNNTSVAKKQ
jgi:regulator of protease activity HflC (stomatin/prohibitin superfamily)